MSLRFATAATLLALAAPASAAEVWFNSTPDADLTGKVVEAMDRNVAAANGRPMEMAINIFAFTEPSIAKKMLTLAKANPNLTINMVTDWSMLSTSGGHMAPFLEAVAAGDYALGCNGLHAAPAKRAACVTELQDLLGGTALGNLNVRYKKDDPYRWDAASGTAVYDHASTEGLDHHKGVAFIVDGIPTELVTGSFNWSPTANDSNYENLMSFSREIPAERAIIRAYAAETGAMFHNAAVSLSGVDVRNYKTWLLAKHAFDAGAGPNPGAEPLPTLLANDSVISMCPNPANMPTLEELRESVDGAIAVMGGNFKDDKMTGGGKVALNHASAAELDAIPGVGAVTVKRIQTWIAAHGPMETFADLRSAGIGTSTAAKIAKGADLRYSEAFFSSKLLDCDKAGTGFAAINSTRMTLVRDATGDGVTTVPGTLPAPAIDLFRRAQPGQTIKIATYGYSASAPEYQEMKKAVERGVKVQVVLNKAFNESVVASLAALATAHPGLVEAKMFKSKTMHEKFAVVGDDVFNGSANLNPSSTGKHAEDRFLIKNDKAFSDAFHAEFDRLWERASVVIPIPIS